MRLLPDKHKLATIAGLLISAAILAWLYLDNPWTRPIRYADETTHQIIARLVVNGPWHGISVSGCTNGVVYVSGTVGDAKALDVLLDDLKKCPRKAPVYLELSCSNGATTQASSGQGFVGSMHPDGSVERVKGTPQR